MRENKPDYGIDYDEERVLLVSESTYRAYLKLLGMTEAEIEINLKQVRETYKDFWKGRTNCHEHSHE